MTDATTRLPPALAEMIARGVSVLVASRDERLRPSVMRAMGSSVDRERGMLTVYLSRAQAGQLLRDIEASGHVAVMFSRPSTHVSVQLKSKQVQLRAMNAQDALALAAYGIGMEREVETVGYSRELTRAMLAHELAELVAVTFEPQEIFDQTPGAQAGARLSGEAA